MPRNENELAPAIETTAEIVPHVDVRLGSLPIRNPAQLVKQATELADVLADIINKQKLFTVIRNRKYVMCEGWTTLGAMLGIVPVEEYCRPIENGFEAKVKLIRASDGGLVGAASAECTFKENTWATSDSYALRSMALTRATGKAFRLSFSWIMKLAGFEATPGEEMMIADGSVEAAQAVANGKVESAKKVSISYSPDLTLFVWGPGCTFVEPVLKSSGMKNVLGQWCIKRADGHNVYKALQEAGIEITEVEHSAQAPSAAPLKEESPQAKASQVAPSSPSAGNNGEVKGFLLDVKDLKTKKQQRYLALTIDGMTGSLFDNPKMHLVDGTTVELFALLIEHKGHPITAQVKHSGQYTNIIGVTRIGKHEWEVTHEGEFLPVRRRDA